jgi:CRP-like cAMP-binding protein
MQHLAVEFGISELAKRTRVEEDSMDTVRALKQVIMFKELSEPVLEIIAGTAEEVSVPAGEEIISVRDAPDALFIIRNGTVRVTSESAKIPPAFFGTGESLGDVLFIDGGRASATAVAVERVDLLVFRSAKVAEALAGHPEAGHQFYRAIARTLARHLRRAAGMIGSSPTTATRRSA